MKNETKVSRNAEIVSLISSGNYTLNDAGELYGVTRERIRQIYTRETGLPVENFRKKKKQARDLKKQKALESVKFYCQGCGKPVLGKDARNKKKNCKDCRSLVKKGRDPASIKHCLFCGKEFFENRRHQTDPTYHQHYCSISCARKYEFNVAKDKSAYLDAVKKMKSNH